MARCTGLPVRSKLCKEYIHVHLLMYPGGLVLTLIRKVFVHFRKSPSCECCQPKALPKAQSTRAEDIWNEVPAFIEVEDELVGRADHSDIEAGLRSSGSHHLGACACLT